MLSRFFAKLNEFIGFHNWKREALSLKNQSPTGIKCGRSLSRRSVLPQKKNLKGGKSNIGAKCKVAQVKLPLFAKNVNDYMFSGSEKLF